MICIGNWKEKQTGLIARAQFNTSLYSLMNNWASLSIIFCPNYPVD